MSASNQFKELAGIIGGIGPEATLYFCSLLLKLRQKEVQKDQDHIPYIYFNNPQIPDRTAFLLTGVDSPLPEFIHTGNVLKNAGATFLVIPCNTAFAFNEEIEAEVGIPVLDMVEMAADNIVKNFGENAKVGVLATSGTLKSQIYQKAIAKKSEKASVLVPEDALQEKVMQVLYEIKSTSVTSESSKVLKSAAEDLAERGADVVILGCTEIPLALKKEDCNFPLIDPMELIAQEVIRRTLESRI
jgi:aspartate racemase